MTRLDFISVCGNQEGRPFTFGGTMTPVELDEGELLYLIHLLEPHVVKANGDETQFSFVPLYNKLYAVAQANLFKHRK